MRLIDADALETIFQNLANSFKGTLNGLAYFNALERLQKAPTVDATEVVRCGKCKHWDAQHCSEGQGWCPKVVGYRRSDWFCAAGERKV